jgi:hypothetical protein
LLLPWHRGPGVLKKKQPDERHPLYLFAQAPPHFPEPSGQVLLQSFNHVPQNAGDPAADVCRVASKTTESITANSQKPIRRSRMVPSTHRKR